MIKKITILMLVLMSILTVTVSAADAIATLNLDDTEIHTGTTFTVTLNVACEEGINGLQGVISYDEAKLELVSVQLIDTTKWVNFGQDLSLAVIHSSSDTTTEADIVKITFKAKDTAEAGTAKVTISDIVVDSDAASNSIKEVGTKEIEVPIGEYYEEVANESEFEIVPGNEIKRENYMTHIVLYVIIGIITIITVLGIVFLLEHNKRK